jgi:hypothetical protein
MNFNAFCKAAALVLAVSVVASPAFAAVNPAPAPLAGASLLGLGVIVAGALGLRRRSRDKVDAAKH